MHLFRSNASIYLKYKYERIKYHILTTYNVKMVNLESEILNLETLVNIFESEILKLIKGNYEI